MISVAFFSRQPCPIRTYLPYEGGVNEASCLICPAGKYCARVGIANPTGYCRAGYYCPSGSSQPNVVICTLGHYCAQGSAIPVPCPAGLGIICSLFFFYLKFYHCLETEHNGPLVLACPSVPCLAYRNDQRLRNDASFESVGHHSATSQQRHPTFS